ncbi:bifunctional UDP-N-acetylmuramoyl-tripeptide:D-alanyl-D-alanine ligase/alanine racemase [Bacteroides propionicifaciens]|uniref:bifunctional UDP-N-acetylmuramoyl-tripeptide:D-alanyl-D-alanine ligase/alanine racemase n=1 Tax=Bacteroides propionicifaciens TaxID=392838 RepID=UPI00037AD7A6|nr:bifunctional UDP-N-acetylmuramoyl-tripeptide:D-alanyl-D-alanine ligase/alanine racemase [Bacteroides propionicifaciens]
MSYTIEKITKLLKAKRVGQTNSTINWLLTDSRSLSFPEDTLFFALYSLHGDGTKYIKDLYGRGVRNFVIAPAQGHKQSQGLDLSSYPDANFLEVENTLKALQRLTTYHRSQFKYPVVGITGSNGKTIVKEWLHQLLSTDRKVVRSPRSYNSQIGVPLSVWQMNEDSDIAIFEAGISEPDEMGVLESIIKPTIGVLTNMGGAHQENFFSMQEKCMEKLKLFKDCDVIIYEADSDLISNCMAKSLLTSREIAWSRYNMERPLFISNVDKNEYSTRISYRYLGLDNFYTIPFIDEASIENSIHCLAICLYLMLSPATIRERMAKLEPVAMRLEVKEGRNNCLVINDSYNSDLLSLDIALDFHYRRSLQNNLKRTLVLSDLLETGQSTPALYRRIGQLISSKDIQRLVGVGKNMSKEFAQFSVGEKTFFNTTDELIKAIKRGDLKFSNESILLKGARTFGFETILEEIELKRHETILEVNLNALVHNLKFYRNQLKPETKIMCMVKASAYGAGAYEIAKTLQDRKVDYLAVAVADEGAELRKIGITTSIVIMNPEVSAFQQLFQYSLEPEVYSFHLLEQLIEAAQREGIASMPIHIKIDTGMHRLGFMPDEIPQLIARLKSQNSLIPKSVFSHLVGSDSVDFDEFSALQIACFDQSSALLQAAFSHKIIRHICNSAAIQRFPSAHYDMVRLGIGLYGVHPSGGTGLETVNTLKTTILQIKEIGPDETVGYSRKGIVDRVTRVAAIPIGYADGLNRRLGNRNGYSLVNGQEAPYLGNICMDVSMIDVTNIDCKEGDEVVIYGEDLPAQVLADKLDTIPYEILANISNRVKRIYFLD